MIRVVNRDMQDIKRRTHRKAITTVIPVVVAVTVIAATFAAVWAGPLPPVHNEKDLPAKELARQVVIYSRPYTGAIYADYVPGSKEVAASFVTPTARNEYEPMQVGLYVPNAKNTLKNITLEVKCPVPFNIGHIFYTPEDELDWLADIHKTEGKSWHAPCDPQLLIGKRSSLPMYVIPANRIAAIEPGRSAAFWVTFKTNEKITAGQHHGTFTVSADGKVIKTVSFVIDVYPFLLPRPKVSYGMYYRPYQTPSAFQGRSFQKLYLANMAEHGMNSMDIDVQIPLLAQENYNLDSSSPLDKPGANSWGSTSTRLYLDNYLKPDEYQPDGGYNAIKLIDNQIKMGIEAGLIQRDHPCKTSQSGFNIKNKASALSVIKKYSSERDWPHILKYMRDEPGPGVFAEVIKHVGEWKRLGVTGIAAMSGQAALRVGYVHSVWIVLAGHITPELQHEAERLGAQVWTYDYNLRTTNTEANRFFSGLYTWSLGLSGNIPYAYMGEPNHQPYFDANWKLSRPSILGYVIPSPAGPVPGVGFEGRREGVDDVRYLQLLEARIEAAGENNRTAKEARDWLTNLRKKSHTTEFHTYYYNCWGADFMDPHSGIDPEDYDTIRVRAARFIIGLPPAEGELNAEPSEWMRMTAEPLESDAFADASLKECLKALKTGTINEKRQAASALALRDGKEILPARDLLISLLDLPDVRIVALRALLNLGPDAAPAIPKLNSMLESKDAFIRCGVICVLTSIGQEAVETLTRCVNDPEKSLANFARESLKNLSK